MTSISGNTDWELAWAVMAGAAFDVTSNLKVDFGYRYINLGSTASGTLTNLNTTAPSIVYDDLEAHEVRVGLRYMFDAGYDAYEPIVTKY